MNSLLYCRAQNTAGLLAQLLSFKQYEVAVSLFDEGMTSKEELISALSTGSNDSADQTFYLLTSPDIREKEDSVYGSWFVICFQIHGASQILSGIQLDLCCAKEASSYRDTLPIKQISIRKMLSLCPEQDAHLICLPYVCTDVPSEHSLTASEYIHATTFLSRSVHISLSSSPSNVEFYYDSYYHRAGDDISVSALILCFEHSEEPDSLIPILSYRQFLINDHSIKESQKTEIARLSPLLVNPLTPPHAAEMIQRKMAFPVPTNTIYKVSPEDYCEIQNQASLWTDAIRTCDPSLFLSNVLEKDADDLLVDVMFPVSGYAGFEEQFRMMERMRSLQPKYQGVHTLSTTYIVSLSEDSAVGFWLDLGWTMMGKAFGNENAVCPALPDVGRYIMHFRKKKSGWKMYSLNWGPLFQYGAWTFDPSESEGWAASKAPEPWPHSRDS